jgi:hypothetical protein
MQKDDYINIDTQFGVFHHASDDEKKFVNSKR